MKKTGIFLGLMLVVSQVYASTLPFTPVGSIGGGFSKTINAGQAINFPAPNSDSDYYDYSFTSQQTKGLLEGFLGIEHPVFDKWLLQTGVVYTQSGTFYPKGTLIQGVDISSEDQYQYRYSLMSRQIMVQTKLMYLVYNRFHPYVLLGLGAAINIASNYTTTVPYTLAYTRLYTNNTNTSFAYRIGVGVDVDLTPYLRLGVAYRIADLGSYSLGSANIDQVPASGTLSQSTLYANEVLTQLTYHL